MLPETRRSVKYEPPGLIELGSIARHTFTVGATIKGGTTIWHCDQHNERSGGSGLDFPGTTKEGCIGRE
jgi:hypothetical protein